MKKKRCIILIDGSNFYFKLKSLGLKNLLSFDYKAFGNLLIKKDRLVKGAYYIGAVQENPKDKRTTLMMANQHKLFRQLNSCGFRYSLGYMLKTEGKYHEKGVDVNIAVDMLVATYEDLCDRIILVSSDTDLLPAILKAKEKGKFVEYVGFSIAPSLAMIANCSEPTLLKKEDLEPFLKK